MPGGSSALAGLERRVHRCSTQPVPGALIRGGWRREYGSAIVRVFTAVLVLGACSSSSDSAATTSVATASTTTAATTIPPTTAAAAVAVERVPLAGQQEVEIRGGPGILAATDDTLWIELHRASHLASLDPETMTVESMDDVPAHCFISAANEVVWTTIFRDNLVTRTDADTGASALLEIPHTCGLKATADGVWIADPNDGLVHRLDPQSGDIIETIDVPEAPTNLLPIGDLLFATGEGSGGWLAVIDVASGEIAHSHAWPEVAHFDDLAPGFGAVWAAGRGDPRLFELDPATGDVIGAIEIGGNPSGIAVGDDALWITLLKGDLVRFDPATNQVTDEWTSDYTWLASPVLAFGSLWMTSLEENVLIRVDPAMLAAR